MEKTTGIMEDHTNTLSALNNGHGITFRTAILPSDREQIRDVIESSGVFSPAEVDIALELADQGLRDGVKSGYHFLFAEHHGEVAGYACYGSIAGTVGGFDIYWIAVRKNLQRLGLGKRLLEKTESLIKDSGGRCIYIETSSREHYLPARSFYKAHGYEKVAVLKDFYSPGDSKVIYSKKIDTPRSGHRHEHRMDFTSLKSR